MEMYAVEGENLHALTSALVRGEYCALPFPRISFVEKSTDRKLAGMLCHTLTGNRHSSCSEREIMGSVPVLNGRNWGKGQIIFKPTNFRIGCLPNLSTTNRRQTRCNHTLNVCVLTELHLHLSFERERKGGTYLIRAATHTYPSPRRHPTKTV
jgi:hypothetical protein